MAAVIPDRTVRHRLGIEDLVRYTLVVLFAAILYLFVLYPLLHVIWRSLLANDVTFVGWPNYQPYFRTPPIAQPTSNTPSAPRSPTPARRPAPPGPERGLPLASLAGLALVRAGFGLPTASAGRCSAIAAEISPPPAGPRNFPMGPTVSVVLLIPAVRAFR